MPSEPVIRSSLAAAACGALIVGGLTLANNSADQRVSMLLAAVPVALVSDIFAPQGAECFAGLFVLSCCALLVLALVHWYLVTRAHDARIALLGTLAFSPLVALPAWMFAGHFFNAQCPPQRLDGPQPAAAM